MYRKDRIAQETKTTMTRFHKQAQQSGLGFVNSDNLSDSVPQWNVNDWPPLLGGWRSGHASVVLDHDNAQTVVVLGGNKQGQGYTDSVLLLNLAEEHKQWREGPPLNEKRCFHAAVVCNGGVYVIGGDNARNKSIERIDVEHLFSGASVRATSNQWTTLNYQLSTREYGYGCSTVAVYNRFIVVMGGLNKNSLTSVDIIDTVMPSNQTVIPGPSMTVPRHGCASAVIGHRIFVVGGGLNVSNAFSSVESLHFDDTSDDTTKKTTAVVYSSSWSAWATCTDIALSDARYLHAAVSVGSCIIVAGGIRSNATVEVLDTERRIVWNLPPLPTGRRSCSMVAFETGIAVIGGQGVDSCETLLLIDKKKQLKVLINFSRFNRG